MKSLRELELKSKRVLLRCDLNVPFNNGKIVDDFRLEQSVPTIQYLSAAKAKIIILAHFGRPDPVFEQKQEDPENPDTLAPVAKALEKLVGKPVDFLGTSILHDNTVSLLKFF